MKKSNLHLLEALLQLRMTGPIILAQIAQTAMGFVDTVMAGRVSPVDLAAVAVGSSIFFPLFLFMVGLLSAVMPLVAQAHGRDDQQGICTSIQQGMIIGMATGILMMGLLLSISPVLVWMDVDPAVVPLTERYLFAVSLGFPAIGVFLALRNGGDGFSQPRLSMFAGFLGLAANIIANYLFIYGKLGLPAMGGVGCGWATSLSMTVMLGAMALMLNRHPATAAIGLFRFRRHLSVGMPTLLLLGLPIGLALFVECSIFSVIALLISRLGAETVAAHQIALNFSGLLFMIPYSLGTALTVRVGFTIGRNQFRRLRRVVYSGLTVAACCAVLTCILIILCADLIAAMYTPAPQVQAVAATLMIYAAVFQLPDAVQINCAGALRGFKDTRVPMVLMIVAYWGIGLPIGYLLGLGGVGGREQGPEGFWIGLICGLTASALLLGRRLILLLRRTSLPRGEYSPRRRKEKLSETARMPPQ